MTTPSTPADDGYAQPYADFDSDLVRRVRQAAYGEDIGQHSWVTVDELRSDIQRLPFSPSTRFVDLGCGPGGPLTFVLKSVGCAGTGVDLSGSALEVARRRAATLGVDQLLTAHQADLDEPLPFADHSFDIAMSLDVVVHVRNRKRFFNEVARVLAHGGRFLFTDAGVLTGVVSNEEVAARSVHGFTQFAARGFNENLLELAGFRILHTEDRTRGLLGNAKGRLAARSTHRDALEALEGSEYFHCQQRYLETVIALSERGALARLMCLAEIATR